MCLELDSKKNHPENLCMESAGGGQNFQQILIICSRDDGKESNGRRSGEERTGNDVI